MLAAKEVMQTDVAMAKSNSPIYEVIKIMVENNITGMPVVNEDMTLAGVVTEKDVLKLLYDKLDKPGTVEDFMTKKVVSFDHESSLLDIATSFMKNNFRRVPILAEGKLVGIISRKDIVKYISEVLHIDRAAV